MLGILIGAIATATLNSLWHQRAAYPRGLMNVMQHSLRAARQNAQSGQCVSTSHQHTLSLLKNLFEEIEPAFLPPSTQDPVFHRYVEDLQNALARATAPSTDCAKAIIALTDTANACEACHRDYR